jgi:hypothetical protein
MLGDVMVAVYSVEYLWQAAYSLGKQMRRGPPIVEQISRMNDWTIMLQLKLFNGTYLAPLSLPKVIRPADGRILSQMKISAEYQTWFTVSWGLRSFH